MQILQKISKKRVKIVKEKGTVSNDDGKNLDFHKYN